MAVETNRFLMFSISIIHPVNQIPQSQETTRILFASFPFELRKILYDAEKELGLDNSESLRVLPSRKTDHRAMPEHGKVGKTV